MTTALRLLAGATLLGLAACVPPVDDYTSAEAPNELSLTDASNAVTVRFAPGSAHLAYRDAARLARLATSGGITPRDRVTVSAAGSPALAERRAAAIQAALLRYGIVVGPGPRGAAARDHATISIERYLVTLPPCPNWSKPASADFTNTQASNFGCATAIGLAQMVASPADLASGRPLGPAEGTPTVAAVQRYLTDKVQPPASSSITSISAPASTNPASTGSTP